jgi:hypothetical protein
MAIYKYVHEDRIDILENFMIRFTQPQEFNDPFEMFPYIQSLFQKGFFEKAITEQSQEDFDYHYLKAIHEGMEKVPEEKRINLPDELWTSVGKLFRPLMEPVAKNLINAFMQQFTRLFHNMLPSSLNNSVGVLCMAKKNDDLLMWGHYANSHKGFIIIFDDNSPFFTQIGHKAQEIRSLQQVRYSFERPKISDFMNLDFMDVFFTKSNYWSYENEWRALRALNESDEILNNNIYLFSFPPESILGVYLGCRMSEEKKDRIKNIFHSNEILKNKIIIQAKLNDNEYKLDYETVFE